MNRSTLTLVFLLAAAICCAKPVMVRQIPAEPGGDITWSITDGLLTATVSGGGPHQAHIRWDAPTVANMPDLQGFDLSFGSASGNYNILNGKDLTTTAQPGAHEVLVKGLASSTSYYWKVRARDSEDNIGAYCAEQTCTSEAAWSAPGSPTSVGQADFPLTLTGNMRLTENVTVNSGTAVTAASSTSLDLNGFTITVGVTGAGRGINFPASVSNCRIFDSSTGGRILASTQAGSECVYIAGALGTGNVIQDVELEFDGLTSWGIEFAASGNGLRVFNVTFDIDGGSNPSDTNLGSGGVAQENSAHFYGCTFDMDSDDGRTYCFSDVNTYAFIWGCTADIRYGADSATINHGFIADRATGELYCHDNDVVVTADRTRIFFSDGPAGTNDRYTWNTIDFTNALNTSTATGFHVRNDLGATQPNITKNVAIGFNTVTLGGNTVVTSALTPAGESAGVAWRTAYFYRNVVTGVAASWQAMRLFGQSDEIYVWGESYTKDAGFTGKSAGWGTGSNPAEQNDFHFNNITLAGSGDPDFDGPASTNTNVNIYVYNGWAQGGGADDDSRITYAGSWTGYNPNADSIPVITGMAQVTGVH